MLTGSLNTSSYKVRAFPRKISIPMDSRSPGILSYVCLSQYTTFGEYEISMYVEKMHNLCHALSLNVAAILRVTWLVQRPCNQIFVKKLPSCVFREWTVIFFSKAQFFITFAYSMLNQKERICRWSKRDLIENSEGFLGILIAPTLDFTKVLQISFVHIHCLNPKPSWEGYSRLTFFSVLAMIEKNKRGHEGLVWPLFISVQQILQWTESICCINLI